LLADRLPQKFGPEIQQRTRNPTADQKSKNQRKKHGGTDPVQVQWEQEFHDHSSDYHQIFTNGTENEVLIQAIKTIIVLGNRYDWKESGAGKEKLYYQNFGRALKGEPSKKWEGLIETI